MHLGVRTVSCAPSTSSQTQKSLWVRGAAEYFTLSQTTTPSTPRPARPFHLWSLLSSIGTGKSFIIFGYGKVGRGVAHRLTQDFKAKVSVVDVTDECLESASRRGFSAFKISDPALHDVIRNCYAIVTCSGVEGLISKSFGTREEVRQLFLKKPKHLSNIGALDEWGGAFDPEDVIFGKRAVNFSLEEPTTIKFLDPAFFARDLAALYLLPTHESKLYTKNGLHPLPDAVNDSVLNDWCNFHNCQLPDLS
eukprot:TRINITY_DN4354_c0_g1_i2.p1 TRINITY_DN4354_c0_g1~~TRINITY_DN4354_c0_g1_i2.p1  ORF type:complete len:250 (-),score=44.61 TRINITY_DN4354_c0_g1_i2:353-1102(-)